MLRDKYKIISKLSAGRKFGVIYLGEEISSGKNVIIKSLLKSPENTTAVNQLNNEAQFDFNISGLPKIIEKIESEHEILLVKYFEEGYPLNKHWKTLKKKEQITFLISLMEKLDSLLSPLYEKEIYHLDLKPGNILINTKKDDFDVKIIDFGLAITKKEPNQRKVLFPLGYAAPELILNQLDLVDQRTDIFALGVSMYTLFTGKLPLSHPNPSIYTNLQITHPIPSSNMIRKGVFQIIEKMTFKHQFRLPPNKLEPSELKIQLQEGMNGRYAHINHIIDDLKKLNQKKSFYQRISFR